VVKVAKTPFGFLAIAMGNQLVELKELPRDPRKVAEIFESDEFERWVEELKRRGYDVEPGLYDPMKAAQLLGVKTAEYLKFAREVGIEWAKIRIKKALGKDMLVIQAISALDDLNRSINIMLNRIREWYGVYYPEYKEENHKKFLKFVLQGKRKESMGVDLSGKDLKAMRKIADMILQMYEVREKLEKYIEKLMEEVAPNVRALAGANLGARLIDRAGGLRQLAELPASTIQVLGAEKALFKHLQKGSPPPKHGIIFQHPVINRAPKKLRGKLARTLAAKIALAARADYYSGKLRPGLVEDWERRVREVLEGEER